MDALIVLLPTAQYLRGQQHLGKGGELSQQGGTPRCATTVCMFQQPGERGRKKKGKKPSSIKVFVSLCVSEPERAYVHMYIFYVARLASCSFVSYIKLQ